jgi:hypothetical protein
VGVLSKPIKKTSDDLFQAFQTSTY